MKRIFLVLIFLVGCSSIDKKPGHAGASAAQSSNQQAVDGMADPTMPATELPPAGAPVLQPTIIP